MPKLDIADLHAPWTHAYVIAVMLQPAASAERHRQIVAGMRAAGALEWRRTDGVASEAAKRLFWQATDAAPFELQRDARAAYSTQGRYSKGRMAGIILGIILAAAGAGERRASLEGAYTEIYNQGGKNKVKGISRNTLREVWAEYQTVSHLWLAHENHPLSLGLLCGDDLADILAIAELIRISGEEHRSQHDDGQLLPAERMWSIPAALQLPAWGISNGKITRV
jgi:hypothetical protein